MARDLKYVWKSKYSGIKIDETESRDETEKRKCTLFDDPRNRHTIHASDFFQETKKTQAHLTETG